MWLVDVDVGRGEAPAIVDGVEQCVTILTTVRVWSGLQLLPGIVEWVTVLADAAKDPRAWRVFARGIAGVVRERAKMRAQNAGLEPWRQSNKH